MKNVTDVVVQTLVIFCLILFVAGGSCAPAKPQPAPIGAASKPTESAEPVESAEPAEPAPAKPAEPPKERFPVFSLIGVEYTDQRDFPEGELGNRVRQFVEAINTDDSEKLKQYCQTTFAPALLNRYTVEEHIGFFRMLYAQSEGFQFYGIRDYAVELPPGFVPLVLQNRRTEQWEVFVLVFSQEQPQLIADVHSLRVKRPKDLPAIKVKNDRALVAQLTEYVNRMAKKEVFSGTVLLAKEGKVLFKAARGLASRRFDVANRIDTKLNIGSMNKMFTAVAILQLEQAGKLSLDDKLSQHISTDWLSGDATEKIQLKHLLTHTSGLGSYFTKEFFETSRLRYRHLADYKPIISKEKLQFEPGTNWRYSNSGMFLLGVVIENVSKQSYFEYIDKNIYQPAGMKNSGCYEMDKPVPNLAIGYAKVDGEWTNNLFDHSLRGGPAGGGFTTVEDLFAFSLALRGYRLLEKQHMERLWTANPDLGSPEYGFGFGLGGTKENRIVGHSGGFKGISANLDMFLDSGYTAAVLANYDMGSGPITQKIRELIGARTAK